MRKKEFREEGISHVHNGALTDVWAAKLPFRLTGAQRRVMEEVRADMAKPHAMARLVQGDVGSGKTAVAAWALLLAAENGWQGAMMAPTEILARQHAETLAAWFGPLGLKVGFFAGGMGQKESRQLREALASGEINVAVGTHALIQEKMAYRRLGLVVIDEQHRFGVRQRALLQGKGDHPDMLIMSATPIPRTLALTLYGDLDVSRIDEMPPGRIPVKTICILEKAREKLNLLLLRELSRGNQAFVVCPLIEESEALDLQNAVDIFTQLEARLKPHKVGLLHGRMSGAEKDMAMGAFARGEIMALVSTTVVEVGVDVPSATVMVIENSERFGLAQLHQLRGRVGRGEQEAYCILVTNTDEPYALQRLKLMTETGDGFRLAEEDLLLRGPGELFGARQHGLPEFRLAKLPEDMLLMERAREAVFELVEADPELDEPEHVGLRLAVAEMTASIGAPI
jgi:ATP-dependent DNA helicase RecG